MIGGGVEGKVGTNRACFEMCGQTPPTLTRWIALNSQRNRIRIEGRVRYITGLLGTAKIRSLKGVLKVILGVPTKQAQIVPF